MFEIRGIPVKVPMVHQRKSGKLKRLQPREDENAKRADGVEQKLRIKNIATTTQDKGEARGEANSSLQECY